VSCDLPLSCASIVAVSHMEDVSSDDNPGMEEAANLLEKIAQNPYEYDAHIQYITKLRELGAYEELRQGRQLLHSFFPLSEGNWIH
jgi:hypothetical protein